jgi:hypothetical protein
VALGAPRCAVIGQILPRGASTRGLLYYLFTEGLAGEKGLESAHSDPRIIASWDGQPQLLQPPVCAGSGRDFTSLVSRLNEPVALLGFSKDRIKQIKPVFHLTIAAAKDSTSGELVDPLLSDEQWADIAGEYMHHLGLARRDDDHGVRWVAVRHAEDHIHVVATLVGQDGRRVHPSNERYRSREASRLVEIKYGLRTTSAATGAGTAPTSRSEQRKFQSTASRRAASGQPGPTAPDRDVLRRHVRTAAAGARDIGEFVERLRADGLLVRERFSERNPGEITGYAVALPNRYDDGGPPIYFGGGKLAPDLTLPRLQRRWAGEPEARRQTGEGSGARGRTTGPGTRDSPSADSGGGSSRRADRFGLTPEERKRIWQQALDAAATATDHIHANAIANPASAADAAWAASDFLAAAGRVVEGRRGGPLTSAASEYDGAARELFGRAPAPTLAGNGLRAAARLLLIAQVAQPSEIKQLLALLAQLSALADAVTRLRETQERAAQAAAARRAAEQLRDVRSHYSTPRPSRGTHEGPSRPRSAARTATGSTARGPVRAPDRKPRR